MSTPNPTHIDVVIEHRWRDGKGCNCGWFPEYRNTHKSGLEMHGEHVVSKLTDAGYSIVSHTDIREMIGPSREVDRCPKCTEVVAWEQNGYDMRDNDDHRYSWRAFCEDCKLDLELIPEPNPPIAAAAEAGKP